MPTWRGRSSRFAARNRPQVGSRCSRSGSGMAHCCGLRSAGGRHGHEAPDGACQSTGHERCWWSLMVVHVRMGFKFLLRVPMTDLIWGRRRLLLTDDLLLVGQRSKLGVRSLVTEKSDCWEMGLIGAAILHRRAGSKAGLGGSGQGVSPAAADGLAPAVVAACGERGRRIG
ncbi:hypothetical protein ACLOJK_004446 [Asimina triloba]